MAKALNSASTNTTAAPVETEIAATPTDLRVSESTRDMRAESQKVLTDIARRDAARKALAAAYEREPRISVMIAPMYIPYFGNQMHVSVNGISISVPCDGRPYEIPESFAATVQHRLRCINEQQTKQHRFSDIAANNETSPGELSLY